MVAGQAMLSERMDDWQESWKQEGIQQGEIRANQAAVMEVLEVKFSNIPDSMASAVNGVGDPARLKAMHREAIRSDSLESFEQWMAQH